MRFPTRRVAQGQHIERMEADDGVEAVVIAAQSVHNLGSLDLFGRFAEELERATDIGRLHRMLGSENSRERADAESKSGDRCARPRIR